MTEQESLDSPQIRAKKAIGLFLVSASESIDPREAIYSFSNMLKLIGDTMADESEEEQRAGLRMLGSRVYVKDISELGTKKDD